MKRKATDTTRAVYKTLCGACGVNLKYRVVPGIQRAIIDHYKAEHPEQRARLYDITGATDDAQYDVLMKAFHNTNSKLEQAVKERDQAAAQQRTLAAKLNAIVLVLRNDA
jgi:hypothetical protein